MKDLCFQTTSKMEILVIHLGSQRECFVSTCILRALKNTKIDYVVRNERTRSVFKYNKKVRNVYTKHKFKKIDKIYDTLIYLDPEQLPNAKANKKMGFGYNKDSEKFYDAIFGNKKINKNAFQIYFNLANMKWHGESYDLYYKPRTKTKKHRTGLSLSNITLKRYIVKKMKLDESNLWQVPYRENIFKKIDELNRCNNVITDDLFTMHLSVFLRKFVFFLKTLPQTTNIELFNKGSVFSVPLNLIK